MIRVLESEETRVNAIWIRASYSQTSKKQALWDSVKLKGFSAAIDAGEFLVSGLG
jgi:hypothetical protein